MARGELGVGKPPFWCEQRLDHFALRTFFSCPVHRATFLFLNNGLPGQRTNRFMSRSYRDGDVRHVHIPQRTKYLVHTFKTRPSSLFRVDLQKLASCRSITEFQGRDNILQNPVLSLRLITCQERPNSFRALQWDLLINRIPLTKACLATRENKRVGTNS